MILLLFFSFGITVANTHFINTLLFKEIALNLYN